MFDVTRRKPWFFLISGLLILPGLIFIALGGLRLGIEFTGGSLLDIRFSERPPVEDVYQEFAALGRTEAVVQGAEGGRVIVRAGEMQPEELARAEAALRERFPETFLDVSTSAVSPSFSEELLRNAVYAIVVASALIVLLVAFAFRNFGWSAFVYGFAAIGALIHDAAFVIGLWAILGYILNVEIDSLFITALLTIIGFSVHDTIVVFDRIRENLRLNPGEPLNPVINYSIMQTLARSLNTTTTTLLVLMAIFLFGGFSIRNFALALVVGILAGTYSSIFNAAQLVSLWQELRDRWRQRRLERALT